MDYKQLHFASQLLRDAFLAWEGYYQWVFELDMPFMGGITACTSLPSASMSGHAARACRPVQLEPPESIAVAIEVSNHNKNNHTN
eukprot:5787327-Amphidinium_carterae.1